VSLVERDLVGGEAAHKMSATLARRELLALVRNFNPSKLSHVPSLLLKYKGREWDLVSTMRSNPSRLWPSPKKLPPLPSYAGNSPRVSAPARLPIRDNSEASARMPSRASSDSAFKPSPHANLSCGARPSPSSDDTRRTNQSHTINIEHDPSSSTKRFNCPLPSRRAYSEEDDASMATGSKRYNRSASLSRRPRTKGGTSRVRKSQSIPRQSTSSSLPQDAKRTFAVSDEGQRMAAKMAQREVIVLHIIT